MRKTWTWVTILIGVAFMIIGYFGSAPWGASGVGNSNPRFSFAPAVFVAGVVIAFSAALVYELLPRRRR